MKNNLLLCLVFLSVCSQAQVATSGYVFPPDNTPDVYRVLMEEYTGHLCGNSPVAESTLYNAIKPLYTDTLVIVSVQAGFFAEPCPPHMLPTGAPAGSYSEDFRTLAGDDWNTVFSITSYPKGMVSRVGYPTSSHVLSFTAWTSAIASIIHNPPKVKIRIHTEYNPQTRQLDVYTETRFLTQLSGDHKLQVVLTEDSIITWQYNYSASNFNDSDYVQRYVMRGSLNGNYGELLNTTSPTPAGTIFLRDYSATLSVTWNENRIHVVAFLYDDNTKEILNVSEDVQFTIVGMDEIVSENSFTVFPNPLTSASILQVNSPLKDAEVIIYDISGKEIIRKKLAGKRMEIGKATLESGIYFLQLRNNGRQYVRKIIVAN